MGRTPNTDTPLGKWIAEHRKGDRVTVAEELGIKRTSLDRLCRDGRRPSLDLAGKIAELTRNAVPLGYWLKVPEHSDADD
jgi:transcriptional regulator with XRE-family HTH domain